MGRGERLTEIELIPFDPDALEPAPAGDDDAEGRPAPAGPPRLVTARLSSVVACGAVLALVAGVIGWQVGHDGRAPGPVAGPVPGHDASVLTVAPPGATFVARPLPTLASVVSGAPSTVASGATTTGTEPPPSPFVGPSVPTSAASVRLLPGAAELQSLIALAPWPLGRDDTKTPLWLIDAGSSSVQVAPLWPGDWPHPLLFAGDHVLFGGEGGVYATHADMPAAARLGNDGYVAPAAQPGHVVVVGRRGERETWGDFSAEAGLAPMRWLPASVVFVVGGAADGLVVRPLEPQTFGEYAYLSAADELRPLAIGVTEPYRVAGTNGAEVLIITASGSVAVVDALTGTTTALFALPGAPLDASTAPAPSWACWSPDRARVVVVDGRATATVLRLADGAVEATVDGVQPWAGIGWTGPAQLVVMGAPPVDAPPDVALVDVVSGARTPVAELVGGNGPTGGWWLAGAATNC